MRSALASWILEQSQFHIEDALREPPATTTGNIGKPDGNRPAPVCFHKQLVRNNEIPGPAKQSLGATSTTQN